MYSRYYQAHVQRQRCWFFVAVLRSYEHIAIDRTIDKQKSTFEFFVSPDSQQDFVELMDVFEKKGMVSDLVELPNRCMD